MSGSSVELRPLATGDEAEWRELWTAYLAFYETSVEEPIYQTTWARLLSGEENEFRGFIARRRDDGTALGIVHFVSHRHCWRVENVIYLQDLYVAEAARGLGVGRALIEAVYAAADSDGAGDVYWLTQDFNETARRLYDRIGRLTPFIKYTRG